MPGASRASWRALLPDATTTAADGEGFELAPIRAMTGAARADRHIYAEARARPFAR
ncbi:hypothetical protein [Falsiroseomonas sp.]|uniref:hypothetical protein n=1 Tax=Falsiroseomonas sp. TaxID=2870721 RepID=UPI0027327D99|nr:hypothetical protein [Falsiroseomonas sp.]MDP3418693.1 hypothetical protein [Falsiroseomonas sp.]